MEYECPECGCTEFELAVRQVVSVLFDGEDHEVTEHPHGDIEWDEDTIATCHDCNHKAPLGEMVAE